MTEDLREYVPHLFSNLSSTNFVLIGESLVFGTIAEVVKTQEEAKAWGKRSGACLSWERSKGVISWRFDLVLDCKV